MQKKNMELLILSAKAHPTEPIAQCVTSSTKEPSDDVKAIAQSLGIPVDVKLVHPKDLRSALTDIGLTICEDPEVHANDYGLKPLEHIPHRVLILDPTNLLETMSPDEFERSEKKPIMVGAGASVTLDDALLHACLGYLRECDREKLGYMVPVEAYKHGKALTEVTLNKRKFNEHQLAELNAHCGYTS